MTCESHICIIISGPSNAVSFFDMYGKRRCNFLGCHTDVDQHGKYAWTSGEPLCFRGLCGSIRINPYVKLYKFTTTDKPDYMYVSALCEMFPEINIYYYEINSLNAIKAICHEYGVTRVYKTSDPKGTARFSVPTIEPFISKLFVAYGNVTGKQFIKLCIEDFDYVRGMFNEYIDYAETECTCNICQYTPDRITVDELDCDDKNCAACFGIGNIPLRRISAETNFSKDHKERSFFLKSSREDISDYIDRYRVLDPTTIISILLRIDSFDILNLVFSKVTFGPDGFVLNVNPLMIAYRMGKIGDAKLIEQQFPQWANQLDVCGRTVDN